MQRIMTNVPAGVGLSWYVDTLDSFDIVKSSTCSVTGQPEKRNLKLLLHNISFRRVDFKGL